MTVFGFLTFSYKGSYKLEDRKPTGNKWVIAHKAKEVMRFEYVLPSGEKAQISKFFKYTREENSIVEEIRTLIKVGDVVLVRVNTENTTWDISNGKQILSNSSECKVNDIIVDSKVCESQFPKDPTDRIAGSVR